MRMLLTAFFIIFVTGSAVAQDFLPSWNDGAVKTAILDFVDAVTEKGGRDYVEPAERIATLRLAGPSV
jgi:hypothetical protein